MLNFYTKQKENKKNGGYTLIEMMISITIFLIVIIYGITSILNAYKVNSKTQNARAILDSLNFAMDDISRNIRIGSNFRCLMEIDDLEKREAFNVSQSCKNNGFGIAFESSIGDPEKNTDQWLYYLAGGKLYKSTSGRDSEFQIIPDEVFIEANESSFAVLGAEGIDSGNTQQPFVVIRLVGKITSMGETVPFSIQTSVSQRLKDI